MAKDAMTERFHDILAGKFAFPDSLPDSLEDLGQIETEDYVAIVHIDGNNMGMPAQGFAAAGIGALY